MTSPDELLKQLHEAARRAREPDPALRQDMLRALAARIHARPGEKPGVEAPGVGVKGTLPASPALAGGKIGLVIVALFVALYGRSDDTVVLTREPAAAQDRVEASRVETAVPESKPAREGPASVEQRDVSDKPAPNPIAVSSDDASVPRAQPRQGSRARTRARARTREAPSTDVSPTSIAEEVALIKRISAAMAGGQASTVLELVAEHEARFPAGTLIEEREAARARASCRLGQREAGEALTVRFQHRWPKSMQLVAVHHDCRKQVEP